MHRPRASRSVSSRRRRGAPTTLPRFHKRHPDVDQERLFFDLLGEAVASGSISKAFIAE